MFFLYLSIYLYLSILILYRRLKQTDRYYEFIGAPFCHLAVPIRDEFDVYVKKKPIPNDITYFSYIFFIKQVMKKLKTQFIFDKLCEL